VKFNYNPKKIYAIVPCSYEAAWENTFELTVFSDHDIKLHELKASAPTASTSKGGKSDKSVPASTNTTTTETTTETTVEATAVEATVEATVETTVETTVEATVETTTEISGNPEISQDTST